MNNLYCRFCGTKSSEIGKIKSDKCPKHPDGHNKGMHELHKKESIRIRVADRIYPLMIDREKEEEDIRKAAKLINDKMLVYQQKYRNKDKFDFLAMTALQFALAFIKNENRNNTAPILNELKDINRELGEFLSREK